MLFRSANVEAAVKAKGYPPLAWYDVLLELSREGGRRLRPVELEKELLVAQYNLSRLLDRMAYAADRHAVKRQKAALGDVLKSARRAVEHAAHAGRWRDVAERDA